LLQADRRAAIALAAALFLAVPLMPLELWVVKWLIDRIQGWSVGEPIGPIVAIAAGLATLLALGSIAIGAPAPMAATRLMEAGTLEEQRLATAKRKLAYRFALARLSATRWGTSGFRAVRLPATRWGTSGFRAVRLPATRRGTSVPGAVRLPATRWGTSVPGVARLPATRPGTCGLRQGGCGFVIRGRPAMRFSMSA